MLDITGGDTTALTEITDIQDLLLRQEEPDLSALARLNVHRNLIAERNTHVPARLPAVWAAIGYPDRAEALARAITDPERRGQALDDLARMAGEQGDVGRAVAVARAITDPERRGRALGAWRGWRGSAVTSSRPWPPLRRLPPRGGNRRYWVTWRGWRGSAVTSSRPWLLPGRYRSGASGAGAG